MSTSLWFSSRDIDRNRRTLIFSNCSIDYFDTRITQLDTYVRKLLIYLTGVLLDLTGALLDLAGDLLVKQLHGLISL